MGKCIVLVGPMCSGKTMLAKVIETLGYRRIVTYTTRCPRPGEIDGVDYHFVKQDHFKELVDNGFFAEVTSYNAAFGFCTYGSAKRDYHTEEDSVIVLNPHGVLMLREPAFIVYLDMPDDVIFERAVKRGDSIQEIQRRILEDKPAFKLLEESGKFNLRISSPVNTEKMAFEIDQIVKSQILHRI